MDNTKELEQLTVYELFIGALSKNILDNVAKYNKIKGSVFDIFALTTELRMDMIFIQIDLGISFIACCKTNNTYIQCYHIKNLYAGMQEAYKLLLGYGKNQRFSIWTKIGNAINSKPISDWEEQPFLYSLFQSVNVKLKEIAGNNSDKTHRDLTFHYSADMKQVYSYTIAANNLDEASEKIFAYLDLLKDMTKLCDIIEDCLKRKGRATEINIISDSIDNNLHLTLIQNLSKDEVLHDMLNNILNDLRTIDEYAFYLDNFKKLKELVYKQTELPEINNILILLNLCLTIQFMRADMAAITQSYLLSKTSGEAMLNMRRYIITITASLSHLYGYSEKEHRNSIWSSVLCMIPENDEKHKKEAAQIENMLQKIVLGKDMEIRTCYVHMYNNKTHKTNIPIIIDLLKKQNPIIELQKVTSIGNL